MFEDHSITERFKFTQNFILLESIRILDSHRSLEIFSILGSCSKLESNSMPES